MLCLAWSATTILRKKRQECVLSLPRSEAVTVCQLRLASLLMTEASARLTWTMTSWLQPAAAKGEPASLKAQVARDL